MAASWSRRVSWPERLAGTGRTVICSSNGRGQTYRHRPSSSLDGDTEAVQNHLGKIGLKVRAGEFAESGGNSLKAQIRNTARMAVAVWAGDAWSGKAATTTAGRDGEGGHGLHHPSLDDIESVLPGVFKVTESLVAAEVDLNKHGEEYPSRGAAFDFADATRGGRHGLEATVGNPLTGGVRLHELPH
jgi:hypothetical protein